MATKRKWKKVEIVTEHQIPLQAGKPLSILAVLDRWQFSPLDDIQIFDELTGRWWNWDSRQQTLYTYVFSSDNRDPDEKTAQEMGLGEGAIERITDALYEEAERVRVANLLNERYGDSEPLSIKDFWA